MNDLKNRIQKVINTYSEKQYKADSQPKRQKNKKPEEELRQEMLKHLRQLGFLALRIESQAVFSQSAGRYMRGQVAAGVSDILACSQDGCFLAIELKAKGRLKTLKSHQSAFLQSVIKQNGFACCCDSIELFDFLWESFASFESDEKRKKFLLEQLPKIKEDAPEESLFKME
jgi:hypothetical protein